MTKQELVDQIKGELTASCALPYSPPTEEIERIIDKEMRWKKLELLELLERSPELSKKQFFHLW